MSSNDQKKQEHGRKIDSIQDIIKAALSSGVKSVLMTEENVRNIVSELLPKEVTSYVKSQVDNLKKEAYSTFVNEFRGFLEHIDLAGEVKKVLSGLTVKINAEISFEKREAGRRASKSSKQKDEGSAVS